MKTKQEGIIVVENDDGEVVAIVRKDPTTHHNLIYSCAISSMEEIEALLVNKIQ